MPLIGMPLIGMPLIGMPLIGMPLIGMLLIDAYTLISTAGLPALITLIKHICYSL